ncbi:MAG: hypothetical protein Q8R44_09585 [Novosphingobium sp.]|nr:hypothetical protein [Novosphingobium sp.]
MSITTRTPVAPEDFGLIFVPFVKAKRQKSSSIECPQSFSLVLTPDRLQQP